MLIRVSGGLKGIAEYLKTGRKKGRSQTRDELDERVVLLGDLDAMHQAISALAKGSEKYLHITLSFREDEVPHETLRGIAESFQTFIKAAYRPDELMCYAEAHIPRIKTLQSKGTGPEIDRFPHIHVIIPKLNLLTGKAADPLGRVARQLSYLDAFQEWANGVYGLASPKDNRRTGFQNRIDILERHNGDHFAGANKELKQKILDAILNKGINSETSFLALLAAMGEVRKRNEGRPDSYFNIKPLGDPRGTNLKEMMFTKAFLEMSESQKREVLQRSVQPRKLVTAGPQCDQGTERPKLLQEWFSLRSKEVKYLNSGNKSAWAAYYDSDEVAKLVIVSKLEARHYSKIDQSDETGQLPLPTFSGPVEPTEFTPVFLQVSESSLGHRIRLEIEESLDAVYLPKLGNQSARFPLDRLEQDLRTKYGLDSEKFGPALMAAHESGPKGLYQFLRRHLSLQPNAVWLYLVQQGLAQPNQLSTPQRIVSDQLWQEYLRRKRKLEAISTMEAAERKAALSVLRMSLVLSRKYLWSQDQIGSQVRRNVETPQDLTRAFSGPDQAVSAHAAEQVFLLPEWSHRTASDGQVEFLRREKVVIRDEGPRVVLQEADSHVMEVALRLAVLKFGPKIRVSGPEDFKQKTVLLASRMKLTIEFSDPELQRELTQLRGELEL